MRRPVVLGLGAIAVLVLVVGGWWLLVSGPDELPSSATPDASTALNCTADGACTRTGLDRTLASCEEWYVGEPGGPTCNRTTAGVAEVALITDPANHVPGPVDRSLFEATIIDDPALDQVWDLEFLDDGTSFLTLNGGTVLRGSGGAYQRVGTVDVLQTGTGGLLGLALDPRFRQNGHIYVFYTYGRHPTYGSAGVLLNRISRFTVSGDGLVNETVLVDAIPGKKYQDGGRLEIGPDGMLYATTGGGATPFNGSVLTFSQDRDSLAGKVLRVRLDGSVPAGNPYSTPVYSRGHKNPSGLAWHPRSGALYASEHGIWRHDEVNRIEPGNNYGFSFFLCGERNPAAAGATVDGRPFHAVVNNTPPVWCARDWTMAPGGAAFVRDPDSRLYGDLFVAGLRGKHLRRLDMEDGAVVDDSIAWLNRGAIERTGMSHRLRDVEWFNGSLWVTGDGRGIARLTP